MRAPLFASALIGALLCSTAVQAKSRDEKRLADYIGEYERGYKDKDEKSEPSYEIGDVSPETYLTLGKNAESLLERVKRIDRKKLSSDAAIDAVVLEELLQSQTQSIHFREWERPFNSDENFWSKIERDEAFKTVEDYDNHLRYLGSIPHNFEQQIENARAGLKRGFSIPKASLVGRDVSFKPYLVETAEQSPFWATFAQMPASFSEADRTRLLTEARAIITDKITPAYRNLFRFYTEEYIPQATTDLAAENLPDGKAYYQFKLRQHTTLDLTPEQIHQIGLDEVARITAEMEKIKAEVGFKGSLREFIDHLRTDKSFTARTPDELMGVSAYVVKRVDGKLSQYFGFLPRSTFTINEVPATIAPYYTSGRGGGNECWMNTYNLASRPLYNIPVLTIHECSPGHSFQDGVAMESTEISPFRRNVYFSGFGEGWGLYTEYLGEEMGIYRTPYEKFGRLSYEMWRAVRLVVDTGIHHYGWPRDKAVEYLASRTALSLHEVGTEIDRYISWPGQAAAYKLGEMTILRLRKKAEDALGQKFDIRKFHDVVLSLGSVPLWVLEQRIDRFIAEGGPGVAGVDYPSLDN